MMKLCRSLPDVCDEWNKTGSARVGINRVQDVEERINALTHVAHDDFARHVTIEREDRPEGFRPPVILKTQLGEAIS